MQPVRSEAGAARGGGGLRRIWSDLPLMRKALVAVLFPILVLLAGFLLLHILAAAERREQLALYRSLQVSVHVGMLQRDILAAESSVRGFAVARDEAFRTPFEHAKNSATAAAGELERLLENDPAQAARLAELQPLLARRFDLMTEVRETAQTGGAANSHLLELVDAGREVGLLLGNQLGAVAAHEQEKHVAFAARLDQLHTLGLAGTAALVLLGLLCAIGAARLLTNSIVRRVQLLGAEADLLARELPLTYFASGRDEISQLARRLQYASGLLTSRTTAWREETRRREASAIERAKIEKALRESEARLQAILDHTGAVIYVKDLESRFQTVNRQFEALFGISRQEARGRTPSELFGDQFGKPLMRHDLEVIRRAIPLEFEEVVPQGGAERTYLSIKFPLLDQTGRPYAICGISTDITLRKAGEQALRAREQGLERPRSFGREEATPHTRAAR